MPPEVTARLQGSYGLSGLPRLFADLAPLIELEDPAVLKVDLRGLSFLLPSTTAVLAAVLSACADREVNAPGSSILWPENQDVRSYLSRVDLIQVALGIEVDEGFARHETHGFLECRQFTGEDDSRTVANQLTQALAERCNLDTEARNAILICLSELCDNVPHHAMSRVGGFAAAQGFPQANRFEAAIADFGIGILASLSENPGYANTRTDVTAIEAALGLGVTSKPLGSGHDRGHHGYGLAITDGLLERNGGQLAVISNRGDVRRGSNHSTVTIDAGWPGTLVIIEARTDRGLNMSRVYDELIGPLDDF
jgi:hypothetical protein